jgi:hypothetical protein
MIILGLAGHAGSGKDATADYLVERYGFIKFSFSDALYAEVAAAFGLESEDLLRDRETKEVGTYDLAPDQCNDFDFRGVIQRCMPGFSEGNAMSPREVLQIWGTAYRRAADPDYWIQQADDWLYDFQHIIPYPELRPQYFVNTSVRFPNERAWVNDLGGNTWHLHRDAAAPVNPHESETPLPVLPGEREIWNNYTLEYLYMGIDQLMSSNIPSIRIEPPEPMVKP